jgi:hypothetical protein
MMGKESPSTPTGDRAVARKHSTRVDPELQSQLDSADKDHPVEAVFTLHAPEETPLLGASEVHQTVDRIVKSAQAESGQEVRDLNVFPNMKSFVVAAPAGVVRAILGSEEIESATANQQSEDLAIEPPPRRRKPPPRGGGKPRKGNS